MSAMLMAAKFKIKLVRMNARYSWQLTLWKDTKLKLGRNDKARSLQRFIEIYSVLLKQTLNDNKRISYVDLRYKLGSGRQMEVAYIEP